MYRLLLQLGSSNNSVFAKARLCINMPSLIHLLYQYGLDWAEREQLLKGNKKRNKKSKKNEKNKNKEAKQHLL